MPHRQSLVFHAVEAGSEKTVAVKKSRVPLRVKRTFLRHEIRVMQILQGHPAIPAPYGYGRLRHFEHLSMELLGRNLKELSASPAQSSVKTVVRVVDQMLSALKHVHQHGIVHRDVKPENMLVSLTDPSKILLTDFGISRFFRTGVLNQYHPLKESRNIVGTLHWTSLNVHNGTDLGPRDDLESLAYVCSFSSAATFRGGLNLSPSRLNVACLASKPPRPHALVPLSPRIFRPSLETCSTTVERSNSIKRRTMTTSKHVFGVWLNSLDVNPTSRSTGFLGCNPNCSVSARPHGK